jgi:putative FmdB family regulatory protein
MPIYEYRCGECGHEQEFLQRLSDAPLTDCPKCGKPALKKLLSAAGFQLKGTGWYATDFKNNNTKPAAKSDKAEASAKATDGAKSSDSAKPAESAAKETPKTESTTPAPAKPTTEKA